MTVRGPRWEHGSDQHWVTASSPTPAIYPWRERGVLFGNGRFALNAVLEVAGAQRVWIPSFYCPEVIAAIPDKALRIAVYRESPAHLVEDLSDLPVEPGDVVVVQNIYGLRVGAPRLPSNAVVVEDHTHDPTGGWAAASRADYCITSLRKLFPVGDGGVAWSPAGRALPPEPVLDDAHARAALDRLTGTLLKTAYLDGGAVDKAVYRAHHVAGEQALAKGPISTLLPVTRGALPGFPIDAWRHDRAANFAAFTAALGTVRGATLFAPRAGAVAFIATVCFETEELRDHVRRTLIASRIYPAVLWPLETATYTVPREDLELSHRILSLHCDHRYTPADLEYVASILREALA